jgi:hypothetical protein
MRRKALAAVLHIEGAEAIDPEMRMLDVLYAAGLRSLGIVWSRPNIFGHGVPFSFPGSPDIGPGLTDAGKDLVRACNRLGIVIDLSHLNEQGFRDVAAITTAPLVASHSNVHALSPTPRNLTDRQLDAIRESKGLVGLNYATAFLRADGAMNADTGLDVMLRHLDALLERLGEDGVARRRRRPRIGLRRGGRPEGDRRCRRPAEPDRRDAPARLRRAADPQDRARQLAEPAGTDVGAIEKGRPLGALFIVAGRRIRPLRLPG